jgi:hypothetical protein
VFLVVHFKLNPFKHSLANGLETTSLTALVVLSGANLIRAVCYYIGVTPSGHMYVLEVLTQWFEVMFFAILPLGIFALTFVVMCYRCGKHALHCKADNHMNNNHNQWTVDKCPRPSTISGNDHRPDQDHVDSICESNIPDLGIDFNRLRQNLYPGHTSVTPPPQRGLNPLHIPMRMSPEYDNTPMMRKWFPSYRRASFGPQMPSLSEDEKDETDLEISVQSDSVTGPMNTSIHKASIHNTPPNIAKLFPSPNRHKDSKLEDSFNSA